MKLELENGTVIEQPSEDDIQGALSSLGDRGNGFAILSQGVMTYVQALGSRDEGYHLEYQEDDTQHHFRVPELVPHDQVVSVFKRYAKGDASWKEELAWEREDLDALSGSGCSGVLLLVLVFLIVATLAI